MVRSRVSWVMVTWDSHGQTQLKTLPSSNFVGVTRQQELRCLLSGYAVTGVGGRGCGGGDGGIGGWPGGSPWEHTAPIHSMKQATNSPYIFDSDLWGNKTKAHVYLK